MKIIFLASLALILFAHAEIQAQDTKITIGKPVIALDEMRRWPYGDETVIWKLNFLNPVFVLYDNGLVIFKQGIDPFKLFSVELTAHETTKKNEHKEFKYPYTFYTIYLDGKKKDELERMLLGLKEKQAVLINEKQWLIAPERYILPGEELWRKD